VFADRAKIEAFDDVRALGTFAEFEQDGGFGTRALGVCGSSAEYLESDVIMCGVGASKDARECALPKFA
jgi:hypothetical protein